MSQKELIMEQLKVQFKSQIEKDYAKDPEKVKNTDVEKTAKEILGNVVVKTMCRMKGIKITQEEIVKMLTEIKNEVVK